jgi:hypothetical protein
MTEAPPHLIVVLAFDADGEGGLRPAFEAAQFDSEARAERFARSLVGMHEGIVAWSREAHPDVGEYGEPKILFQHGNVPDMD